MKKQPTANHDRERKSKGRVHQRARFRTVLITLATLMLVLFHAVALPAAQPGVDDFVDEINAKITAIQAEIQKGPQAQFALVEEQMDWVIRHLDLNWHTLSAVISVERETNPSYTPKKILPLPPELQEDYFAGELKKLGDVYDDLITKIDKLKIEVGIKKFATLVNILYAAYETGATAKDLMDPGILNLYNLPGKVDELKQLADQINTSANNLKSAKEALRQVMDAKEKTMAYFRAIRNTRIELVKHDVKLKRLQTLRLLAVDGIAGGDVILDPPPAPGIDFIADPFIADIDALKQKLSLGAIRWPAAEPIKAILYRQAEAAYAASDKDAADRDEWADFTAAWDRLQALFTQRETHLAHLAGLGAEWQSLVAALLEAYRQISAGTDDTLLTDCAAVHDVDPNLVADYDGFSPGWWQSNSPILAALKQTGLPARQNERTLDLNTGSWIDFILAYPGRVKAQLLDPYHEAAHTMVASMSAATERNADIPRAYQMPLLTRPSLDTLRGNLRRIQENLVDFEGDLKIMVADMESLASRFKPIADQAAAYRAYIEANALYLDQGDLVFSTAATHDAGLTVFETDHLIGALESEIRSLPVLLGVAGDAVTTVWDQASALEKWLDDLFRFNDALATRGDLAERMAPYMTGIYTGYGSPGYLYDSLAILDNTLWRILRYELEGQAYDGYQADKNALQIHLANIAAMSPAMLADFASLTEEIRQWTARLAYVGFYLQSNRPYKTDALTRGRYPFWAVQPPPPGWPVFSENRAAADRLNAVHWPGHGFGGSSERYGYMTPADIRAGLPAVKDYVAGLAPSPVKKRYHIVRLETGVPRLTADAASLTAFRVVVMDDAGQPAPDVRVRMTRTGISTVTAADQFDLTDETGLADFFLGPYPEPGTFTERIDVPGHGGAIDVAVEVAPRTDYAVYDGSGGMTVASPPSIPVVPPPVETPFPPVPRPIVQGLTWDARAMHAFGVSQGSIAIEGFLSFRDHLMVLAAQEWIADGTTPNRRNRVWTSRDGETWTPAAEDPPWSARRGFQAVVHKDRLYVMGGITGFSEARGGTDEEKIFDLWYTEDGTSWTQASAGVDFLADLENFRLVSTGDLLWLIGYANAAGTPENPVWHSPDGITWTLFSADAPWPARPVDSAGLTVHEGKIWIAGGQNPAADAPREFADVWVLDPATTPPAWTLVTDAPNWPQRAYAQLFSHNGVLWLWGGRQQNADQTDAGLPFQIWLSTTGSFWSEPVPGFQHPAYAQASPVISCAGELYSLYSNDYLHNSFSLWISPSPLSMTALPGKQQWFPVDPRPTTFSAGTTHVAAVAPDGTLWTWGDNAAGQLGNGGKGWPAGSAFPLRVGAQRSWRAVSAGEGYTLAIAADGTLWSWGKNTYGQLGDGTLLEHLLPQQVGGDNDWIDISAGQAHALARKSDGTLWAWGRNHVGQLGDGTRTDRLQPVQIGDQTDWIGIAAGDAHSLGLKGDGAVWGWGLSAARGFSHDVGDVPGQGRQGVYFDTGESYDHWAHFREGVLAVSAGGNNGVALRKSGTIHPWTLATYLQRDPFDTRKAWLGAAAGADFFLALTSDNGLWGWGKNNAMILGPAAGAETPTAVRIGSDNDWVAVDAGGTAESPFAVARKQDGSLWIWGSGFNGEAGNGTKQGSAEPRPVLPFHQHSQDSDGDWLPDAWEKKWFGTLLRDGSQDLDGDRVSDFKEYYFAMRPDLADTDGDGVFDPWELAMALNPAFDDGNLLSADPQRTTLERVDLAEKTVTLGAMKVFEMAVSGDHLYLVGSQENPAGETSPHLMILSLREDSPGEIVADQPFQGNGRQLQVDGQRLFLNDGDRLVVYDVSDPQSPFHRGDLSFDGVFIQGYAVDGDRLYVTVPSWGPEPTESLQVWDIQDIDHPVKRGGCPDGGDGHVQVIDANRIVVTGGGNQLVLVGVEDPAQPRVLGRFDTFDHPCGDLIWPPVIYADGPRNRLYAGVNGDQGFETSDVPHLKILDITDPSNIIYPDRRHDIFRLDGFVQALIPAGDGHLGVLTTDVDTGDPFIRLIDREAAPRIDQVSGLSQFLDEPRHVAATDRWFLILGQAAPHHTLEMIPLHRLVGAVPDRPKSVIAIETSRVAPGETIRFDGTGSFHRPGTRPLIRAQWDFDYDGTEFTADAEGFEATWRFAAFGTYTVALRTTGTDASGAETQDTALARVTVDQGNFPPRALAGGPYEVLPGAPVLLDGQGSLDPDAAHGDRIVSHRWDLDNDGQFDDAQGPTVLLTAEAMTRLGFQGPADSLSGAPSNPIALMVTDSLGAAAVSRTTVTLFENRPQARFTLFPLAPAVGEPVIFDAGASAPGFGTPGNLSYEWDFTYDGYRFDSLETGIKTAHTFATAGDHRVALRVTDNTAPAQSALAVMEVSVTPGITAPLAVLPPVTLGREGEALVLDGGASGDRGGPALQSWQWDLSGNGAYNDGEGETLSLSWPQVQSLGWPFPADLETGEPRVLARLRVTNAIGLWATAETRVIIAPQNALTAVIAPLSGPVQSGIPVGFSAAASRHETPGGAIGTYQWDFDYDGLGFDIEARGIEVDHSFTRLGPHTVALRITDAQDPTQQALTVATVNVGGNQPPLAQPGGPYVLAHDGILTLNGADSADPDEAAGDRIAVYAWDLDGDGLYNDAFGEAPSVSAEFLLGLGLAGPADPVTGSPTNPISLRVTDAFGLSATAETTLTIYHDAPRAFFTASPLPVVADQATTFDAALSAHGHPQRRIVAYEWDFHHDRAQFTPQATGETVQYTFSAEALAEETLVALRVTDDGTPQKQDVYTFSVAAGQAQRPPLVRTLLITGTTPTAAVVHGTLLSDGGTPIQRRGVVYGTDAGTLEQTGTRLEAEAGPAAGFSAALANLATQTVYHVRAWAENEAGIGYGATVSFTTLRTSIPGDINADDRVDLADLVLGLRIVSGLETEGVDRGAAIGKDRRIGARELVFILKKIAGS